MATLQDIRRRIRSVQSTQKITRAMKLVAAAKLRRAQERILSARPYANKMAELLGNLVGATESTDGAAHPLLEQREGPRRQIVIITADRGLAGAFNSNVLRNSIASTCLWVIPAACLGIALASWDNSLPLQLAAAVFGISYTLAYRRLVRFRVPGWMVIRASRRAVQKPDDEEAKLASG